MPTGNLKNYLGVGAIADRPTTLDLYPDCLGLYLDDDTGELTLWNGVAWEALPTGLADAPSDGTTYGRMNAAWVAIAAGLPDAPSDGSSYARNNGAWAIVPAPDKRYSAASFAPLVNVAGLTVFRHQFAIAVGLPVSLTGSQFSATTAATASATYTIRKNGASIGTLVWAVGAVNPTVTFASAQSFVAGDVLDVVGPATADTTLAGITITFLGTKA